MSYMRISNYIQELRNAFALFGVDYKEKVLGKSAEGRNIISFLLPRMEVSNLIMGFPHPNEPLSQVMMMQIARKAEQFQNQGNEFWFLIPVWDIDGAIRNQDWFLNADSIVEMVNGWYRPAANRQVEWDFPLESGGYKHSSSLPETEIIKNLLDEVHPQRLISLHNGIVGNAYCYISQGLHDKARDLSKALQLSGLDIAEEPPVPYSEVIDLGLFRYLMPLNRLIG
ncbi:hypothetical protein KIMH_09740 [Bombiscardovia apis]|uniref:Peptidase M14 carboxypeptidase A domain-containing protein n=1 Tax=Bombiscardovia apis TaxID=2932182 RepID=A0ABM8BD86_9BIFI|nr:hypothetical protein [Bombiscardovia apis]BDR54863.1 hypothetical protein KIMH_09740 [Bombiscardovia apis]